MGHACVVASVDEEGRLTEQAVGGGIDEGWGTAWGDDGTSWVPEGVSDAWKTRVSKGRQ